MESQTEAHIDFETRAAVDLRTSGVHRYAEDAHTGIWCLAWRIGESGPVNLWRPGDFPPVELMAHVEQGLPVVAHNAMFERHIWNSVLRREHPEFPPLRIAQQICTMARAVALALPASLDMLGTALRARVQKDRDGHAVMMRMCKPRAWETHVRPDGASVEVPLWVDGEAMRETLERYCMTDVEVETAIGQQLPYLSDRETAIWSLDQEINDRGVLIDVDSARRLYSVVEVARKRADERMWWLTDGEVQKCTQVGRLKEWIIARGIPCESVGKGEEQELLTGAQLLSDEHAEAAIRLRRAAGKSSTAKFNAMLNAACADNRVRGTLAYHGATTGRWAGRLIQPQNFPRVDADRDLPHVENVLELLTTKMTPTELCDAMELLHDSPLELLSKCLRAMIVAPAGAVLVGGDSSNIEGRVNAWMAGEAWKTQAFAAYDAGKGPDLYLKAYAESFGTDIESVTKAQRQIGKVQELALGYQGGVGAYLNMGANYGVKPHEVAAVARENSSDQEWSTAKKSFHASNSHGLDDWVWTGIKVVVNRWRNANGRIVKGWWDLQDASIAALSNPGSVVPVQQYEGRVRYLAKNGFLFCALPSKRVLAYAAPRLKQTERNGVKRMQVEYDGLDSLTNKWCSQVLYGGEQCNHVVQGTARDLMAEAMFAAEAEGFRTILTVHDELLTEAPQNGTLTAERLRDLMTQLPEWAEGLPIAASTWSGQRYTK